MLMQSTYTADASSGTAAMAERGRTYMGAARCGSQTQVGMAIALHKPAKNRPGEGTRVGAWQERIVGLVAMGSCICSLGGDTVGQAWDTGRQAGDRDSRSEEHSGRSW